MNIRAVEATDWQSICRLGVEFYQDKTLRGEFVPSVFVRNWKQMIEGGFGHVFVGEDSESRVVGTIGGFITPDPCNDELVAMEAFWFVGAESRGKAGMKLLDHWIGFTQKAGCKRLTMVALCNTQLERMTRLYQRLGFESCETHFVRECS